MSLEQRKPVIRRALRSADVEHSEGIAYTNDMTRAEIKPEGNLDTFSLQVLTPEPCVEQPARRGIHKIGAEEKRRADDAKRIRADAAAGTLEDLTGIRSKKLMTRLLRK